MVFCSSEPSTSMRASSFCHVLWSLFAIVVEVPVCSFCLHVLACAQVVDGRDGHLNGQFTRVGRVEGERGTKCTPVGHIGIPQTAAPVHQPIRGDGARELCTEIHLAQLCPASDNTVSLNGALVHHTQLALDDVISTSASVVGLSTEGTAVQIENYALRFSCRVGISVYAGVHGGREFHLHIAFLQLHPVVSGLGTLLLVLEVLPEVAF